MVDSLAQIANNISTFVDYDSLALDVVDKTKLDANMNGARGAKNSLDSIREDSAKLLCCQQDGSADS